jgi:hypothetical protein
LRIEGCGGEKHAVSLWIPIRNWRLEPGNWSGGRTIQTGIPQSLHSQFKIHKYFLTRIEICGTFPRMLKKLLEPKAEVLAGKLQGVIDIERVADSKRRALESRPRDFLQSTFCSGEIRRLVEAIHKRLNSAEAETGLFLAEGPKGVGKSHGLLIPVHLCTSPAECQTWLGENGLTFSAPADTRVITRKFTDFPLESLWGVIGQELGAAFRNAQPPDINEFRAALGGKKLVLIFDELESGVRSISDPALRQRNLNFLQMLSEESNRAGSNVVLIASIYDGNGEPGLTLKRVPRVELRFQDSADRRKVLFHRLFNKSPLAASAEIDSVVQSYLNTWRRFGIELSPDYTDQLRQAFPFTPELLDVALVRIRQSKGGFQGTRGALGFLAALVRSRCEATHLISLADASMLDPELRSWLADLDPSQNLLACAESNLRELRANQFADQIASATLLATLAPTPKQQGITEVELARQVINPGADYNAYRISLTNFKKLGSFFHERAGCLFFDTRENANAKVNLRALSVTDEEAWEQIVRWWANDVLRESELVVFSDPASTRALLDGSSQAAIRFLAAPRRLKPEEIHQVFFGLKRRNTVVAFEPRDERVDLRRNADLLKYAKNWLAADYLARTAGDATKSAEFSKIGGDDKRNAVDYLKKTNFQHIQIVKFGPTPAECEFQTEGLPAAATREQIAQHLLRTLYPASLIQEHLSGRIADLIGKKVGQVEAEYRNTLGFPMLMAENVFADAVHNLVSQGTVIGLRHPAGDACGHTPRLRWDQLADAVISEPFDETGAPSTGFQPGLPLTPPRPTIGAPANPAGTADITTPTTALADVGTSFMPSRQLLRQEVARLLGDNEGGRILSVQIALTFDERKVDVSALPSFLRGSLAGVAAFHGESALQFSGPFTKAQVEEMVERLPDFSPGSCRVKLGIEAMAQESFA